MEERKTGCARIPERYIFALLSFCGIALQYIMKTNMSVGIVAMAKKTAPPNDSESCPMYDVKSDIFDRGEIGEFDWTSQDQSHVLASYFFGYAATQLLGGYMSQRFGGRWIVGPCILVTAVVTIGTVFAARIHFGFLLALRIIAGLASGMVIPATQTMFSRWFPPQERSRCAGFVFSAVFFGSVTGMALSGFLSNWGWPVIFYGTGTLGIIWFIPWVICAFDSPKTHPRITLEEKHYILEELGHDPHTQHKLPKKVPWLKIFTSYPVWAAIVFHFGAVWILYTELNHLPFYLYNILHFNVQESGYLSATPWLLAWISGNFSGGLSQRLRNHGWVSHLTAYKIFNGIVIVGGCLCFAVIIVVQCQVIITMVMFVLITFFNAFIYGGSYLNHIDLSPNHAGVITGILHTIINACGFLTPVVLGALIEEKNTIDRWHIYFYITIGIACSCYLVYAIFGSVEEQPWNSYGIDEDDDEEYKF